MTRRQQHWGVKDTALLLMRLGTDGPAGMMLALECRSRGARVHLFGFNWSARHWRKHAMGAEEAHARRLHALGALYIHTPVCSGLRTCGGCTIVADVNACVLAL